LRTDAEKKATLAAEATNQYKQCLVETNVKKDRYYKETIPAILNVMQEGDENNRVAFVKTTLSKYSQVLGEQQPGIKSSIDGMADIFANISGKYDSDLFVKLMRSGEPFPADFQFEEKPLKEFSATRKPTTRGLTSSRDQMDDKQEDAIISMPAKQGRKKAMERIKTLDKDLVEIEKKRNGLDTLGAVYKDKPQLSQDPKVAQDLREQREALDKRSETLILKKHKLMCYIANIDGTPPPDTPACLVGKPLTSPITPFSDTGNEEDSPAAASFESHNEEAESEEQSSSAPPPPPPPPGRGAPHDEGETILGRAKALFDFEATPNSQELTIKAGDELDILEKQEDGWWKVRTADPSTMTREGFVPGNYTEEL
ncbi:hypothetical protein BDK51DRAFT_34406, partial [Blyttiomyces helicus]